MNGLRKTRSVYAYNKECSMQSYPLYLWGAGVAALVALIAIFALRPVALHFDLMDHPGGRKKHQVQTPLIGGLAIFFGLCASLFILPLSSHLYSGMLVGACVLMIAGVIDDIHANRASVRFFAQAMSVLCFILIGHHSINYVGGLFFVPNLYLSAFSVPVTVFLVVGFINAVNMLDGQDGLAGGVVLMEVILLFLISLYLKAFMISLLLFVFLALNVIFLCFNAPLPRRRHAIIFLGDSGSNFLAFFVAWVVVILSQMESDVIKPVTFLWVVGFPLFDMTSACFIRKRAGLSWFEASHDHVHHLLQAKNIPLFWSTLSLSLFSLSLGLFGLFLCRMQVPEGWQFVLFLSAFLGYLSLTKRLSSDENETPYDEGELQPDL